MSNVYSIYKIASAFDNMLHWLSQAKSGTEYMNRLKNVMSLKTLPEFVSFYNKNIATHPEAMIGPIERLSSADLAYAKAMFDISRTYARGRASYNPVEKIPEWYWQHK